MRNRSIASPGAGRRQLVQANNKRSLISMKQYAFSEQNDIAMVTIIIGLLKTLLPSAVRLVTDGNKCLS
ncbi:hypothetical protein [Chitinophaga agri]|uniref:Uncharacterized protein n=1 Tax=Chitinophaga agri TaxID=2703787 RepID=A0A6B9ZEX0_9BACT|nr:hypothetical protein [Chitinophaga agri]QHS59705.1 hypothetical protein GWR21_08905 [Chitinophaga agri]